ncbi:MAG: CBS domain-containing protein [Saprospiraceae bacterium]|nr:CBS domain-containing protein [Saprospiraceae bacterium]
MKKKEPVSHIMTHNVHSIQVGDGLKRAVDLIHKYHVRHLPVIKNGTIVGMLSSTDLNRLTFSNLFENQESADDAILEMLTIEHVMSGHPTVVSPQHQIREVAEIFADKQFHALPVVEDDKLVGIVTTTDIIKYLLEQY